MSWPRSIMLSCNAPLCVHAAPSPTRPLHCRVVYDRGFVRGFSTMGVPVRPGVSRVFGRFAFGSGAAKPPLLFRLLGKLPHWTRLQTNLADQDTVVNAKQVRPELGLCAAESLRLPCWHARLRVLSTQGLLRLLLLLALPACCRRRTCGRRA